MRGPTHDGLAAFLSLLGLTIRELTLEEKQAFLNRLAHYVKRATRGEQANLGTVSAEDVETILRLHQGLLEWERLADQWES